VRRVALLACLAGVLVSAAGGASATTSSVSLIVYWSTTPWPSIWAMQPDGTHRRRILLDRQNGKRPRLDPDRQWVAFDGAPPGKAVLSDFDLQLVKIDGTGLRTLTSGAEWDVDAQWSPDGRKIDFTRMPPGADWKHAHIWTIHRDGTGLARVVKGQDARWSPDGRRIVFDAPTRESEGDVFVANADGSGVRRLTTARGWESPAAWSRDGRTILFTRMPASGANEPSVMTMNADGSSLRRLGRGFAAAWSPDGTKILYASSVDPDTSRLYVMDADGSHRRRLSSVAAADPSWR
jgi:Tol biopolymer transport system component